VVNARSVDVAEVTVKNAVAVVGKNGTRRRNLVDASATRTARSVVDVTGTEARGVKNVPNVAAVGMRRMKRHQRARSVQSADPHAATNRMSQIGRTVGAAVMSGMNPVTVTRIRTKTTRERTIRGPTARAARTRRTKTRHVKNVDVTGTDGMIQMTGRACVPTRTANLGASVEVGVTNRMNHVGAIGMMTEAAIGTEEATTARTGTAIPRTGVNSKVAGNASLCPARQVKNCSSPRG
jgi:hypothetical protein